MNEPPNFGGLSGVSPGLGYSPHPSDLMVNRAIGVTSIVAVKTNTPNVCNPPPARYMIGQATIHTIVAIIINFNVVLIPLSS